MTDCFEQIIITGFRISDQFSYQVQGIYAEKLHPEKRHVLYRFIWKCPPSLRIFAVFSRLVLFYFQSMLIVCFELVKISMSVASSNLKSKGKKHKEIR